MRIHYIQHIHFEGPGAIEDWCQARGHQISGTRIFKNEPLPALGEFDFLVIMGGPMGVADIDEYPWLREEKRFLKEVTGHGKPVLGICLGAQLLSECLGGEVRKNPEKELGWHPVSLTPLGWNSPIFGGLPGTFPALHWHGDTFSIPPGAHHIASSEGCHNQAFALDNRIVGLQFHLEVTTEGLQGLIEASQGELEQDGRYIQDPQEILGRNDLITESHGLLFSLLDPLASAGGEDG